MVLIGIGSLAIQGLNLGIDFQGGSQFSFKTPQAHQIQDVRAQTTRLGVGDAVIQGRGPVENGAYKEFQVRTPSLGQQEQTELTAALTSNLDATSVGVKNVSASFSRQILKGAILAIIVSLALIVIYVTLRFEFKFSLPVLIALVHDILITLGKQYHIIRLCSTNDALFVYVVLDKTRANLAMARIRLGDIEKQMEIA